MPERSVLVLTIRTRGAEEEVRILVAGVGPCAVIGPRGGVIDRGGLVRKCDLVGRPVGEIAEPLMPETAAKRQLVLAPDFVHVLIDIDNHLAHAVIPLGTAIR